jgi:hypothetical protein
MPDDLYSRDILVWSQNQADLLRRLAGGERVDDVDWPNLIEEVENVGRSELRACSSLLLRALEHLVKLHFWPSDPAARHWRGEAAACLADASLAFAPSMRQKIDVEGLFQRSLDVVGAMGADATAPSRCPFSLDDLLASRPDLDGLLRKLAVPEVG